MEEKDLPDGGVIVSHGTEVQTARKWDLWGMKSSGECRGYETGWDQVRMGLITILRNENFFYQLP